MTSSLRRSQAFSWVLGFSIVGILWLMGCDIEAPKRYGDRCPPVGSEASMENDANYNAVSQACNHHYSCLKGEEAGTYRCVLGTIQECGTGQVICEDTCITPETDNNFCGARGDCDNTDALSEDYVGDVCSASEACVDGRCQCKGDAPVRCDGECINPRVDDRYCGASDDCLGPNAGIVCVGGQSCEDRLCQCPAGEVFCGGECIDPKSNDTYCGASGDCLGSNKGAVCSGGQSCMDRECQCQRGEVLCDGVCVDPIVDAVHCGARGACNSGDMGSNDYRGETCDEERNEQCSAGRCIVSSCNDNMRLCPITEEDGSYQGQNECFDVSNDASHCGDCFQACQNVVATGVKLAEPACVEKVCHYACEEGYENCNKSTNASLAPLCISVASFQTRSDHCGKCNKTCESNEYCSLGECVVSNCSDDTCPAIDCKNTIKQCGSQCRDCRPLGDTVNCKMSAGSAYCEVTKCKPGYHLPPSQNKGEDTACLPNTAAACAPPNSSAVVDCMAPGTKNAYCDGDGYCVVTSCEEGYVLKGGKCDPCCSEGGNIDAFTCGEGGSCRVLKCAVGYHKSIYSLGDNELCSPNTVTTCGKRDSALTVNCTSVKTRAVEAYCDEDGDCVPTECAPDFHITNDGLAGGIISPPAAIKPKCIQNSAARCAPPTSSVAKPVISGHTCRKGVGVDLRNNTRIVCPPAYMLACSHSPASETEDLRYCQLDRSSKVESYACGKLEGSGPSSKVICGNQAMHLINDTACSECSACGGMLDTCYRDENGKPKCRRGLYPLDLVADI